MWEQSGMMVKKENQNNKPQIFMNNRYLASNFKIFVLLCYIFFYVHLTQTQAQWAPNVCLETHTV